MCDLGKKISTLHWRRDIKTPALHEINFETVKRNNYSSDNLFKMCRNRKSRRNNARDIHWKLFDKAKKKVRAQLA